MSNDSPKTRCEVLTTYHEQTAPHCRVIARGAEIELPTKVFLARLAAGLVKEVKPKPKAKEEPKSAPRQQAALPPGSETKEHGETVPEGTEAKTEKAAEAIPEGLDPWPLRAAPTDYLRRSPDGPKAVLAQAYVDAGLGGYQAPVED